MYCPRCAAQNVDDARFCRACGSDISLVPQALDGRLPEARKESEDEAGRDRKKKRKEKEATVEAGVQSILGGLGFVAVALCVFFFGPAGPVWFYWMFIPAFFMLGEGISQIMRARREQARALPPPAAAGYAAPAVPPSWRAAELPARPADPGYVPPSITEGTTRHLANAGEEFGARPEPESRAR